MEHDIETARHGGVSFVRRSSPEYTRVEQLQAAKPDTHRRAPSGELREIPRADRDGIEADRVGRKSRAESPPDS
jgi:hypothetical protein